MSPPEVAAGGGPAETPVPAWLRALPRAPEYRPTESEFADPIAFLSRVEREAAAYGICKVIPPYPRPSRRFVFGHLNRSLVSSSSNAAAPNPSTTTSGSSNPASSRPDSAAVFTTRHQELGTPRRGRPPPQVLKQVWQSGEQYTLEQFEAKSRAFSKTYLAGLREPTPLEVESLFWKASTDRPIYIEYANDVPGSGFAAPAQSRRQKKGRREGVSMDDGEKGSGWRLSGSPWNLQVIARAPGSITRFMPDDVPGVTSPMVYIGMLFSWFAWHVEDHELHSLNFLHTGAPKTWYAIPGDQAVELEEVIRVHGYGGNSDRLASLAVLGEKTTLMSPEVLVACGLPCCRLVQYPGEFVVTFPRAYHVGFSHGFNCGEAANFATPQWLKFAKEAAVRRAVMNYLPMLSHQQLLYLLAVSFVSRTPRVLSGMRTSRLRDRIKEERELLVKQEFLQDMISENNFLYSFLKKKSIDDVVLWEPDLLPSATALHSCSSGPKAPEKKFDDGCGIESCQCNKYNNNNSFDGTACMTGTNPKCMSTNSKSSCAKSATEEEKPDTDADDEDDLPFDLSIDSGSLTCVACGILGYPFMAILQPSMEALEGISLVHTERILPCCNRERSENVPSDSLGSERTGSGDIEVEAVQSCDNNINWNTNCTFARPRIFCLQHALEIEELLAGKGGVRALIICHSDYIKIKALAISIAEEIEFQFDCTDVPLANASKSDLHLINISIDDEGHEEDGKDWTSQLGLNLKYCAKLRKEISGNQELTKETSGSEEQPPSSFWGLFSNPSPISVVPNLKWLCRKARTPYKVIGFITSSSATATSEKVKPEVTKTEIDTAGNVYGDENNQLSLQQCGLLCVKKQCGLLQRSRLQDCNDIASMHLCSEEDDHKRHGLVDIPIALAECPMMHQVSDGAVSVSTCNDYICSSDSQDSPLFSTSPVEVTRDQGYLPMIELSNSTTVSVHQFLDDESISVEGSMNSVSKHGYVESCNATLGCRDELLQVQQDWEKMEVCNNLNRKSVVPCLIDGLACSERKHGGTESATFKDEEGCARISYCSDTVLKTYKSTTDNQPETRDLGAIPMREKSSCDEMICSAYRQSSLIFGCHGSTDIPCSVEPLSVPHDLICDAPQVETSHSVGKAIEQPKSSSPTMFKPEPPQRDVIILEAVQAASITAFTRQDGKSVSTGSDSFHILFGALAEECKVADGPGKDEVSKASLTLMTLASNDHPAAEVREDKVEEMAKTDKIMGVTEDGQQVDRPHNYVSDLVCRSIGRSSRTDIIYYVRHKHKRKRKSHTDSSQSLGSFARSPCESLRPRTRPSVVEETAKDYRTLEASVARKDKRTKVGPFHCDIDFCDMAFETKAELNAHKRNICTDESCGKRFGSHKYLKRHQCVHSDARPLKCPWDGCGMTFKWLWAQTEHLRVHTGERPYKCSDPDCGQTFRYVSDHCRHKKKFNHY